MRYVVKQAGKRNYVMVVGYNTDGTVREMISCSSQFNARKFDTEDAAAYAAEKVADHTMQTWMVQKISTEDRWS